VLKRSEAAAVAAREHAFEVATDLGLVNALLEAETFRWNFFQGGFSSLQYDLSRLP
jgi:hypothetical protein